MRNRPRIVSLLMCASSLSACTAYYSPSSSPNYPTYSYESTPYYQGGYDSYAYPDVTQEKARVVVPENYHVGPAHSPTPHATLDKDWVHSQNAQGYTIELADGDKADQVANTLYKAPKDERMAEVKYQRDGKTYYKGLYGTYPTYEAAQKALTSLPPDVKQNAGVKSWGSVQSGVGE